MIHAAIMPKAELTRLPIGQKEVTVPVYTFNTVVVGSGAAGFGCADAIAAQARESQTVAVITEGINMGTSRNTGSDKQTYYKLTLSGDAPDSVEDMARSFFDGGSMDGDLALCEAAGSARAFMRLVNLGVPFPSNDYGEYVGYQTDHDVRTRATSCGPLTSRFMTEALERSVKSRNVPIFDGYRVIRILTENGQTLGIAALCSHETGLYNEWGLTLFRASNTVWATGGPSAIYAATVYPESQTCAHGTALEAGAAAVNVTESQYGLASVKFRWNLSGTYQQVLPRYFSTAPDGSDEQEFLDSYFAGTPDTLTAIFKKGYQWPFDPAKLGSGSSVVDLAVFAERQKGRRVYMDFRRNPSAAESDGGLAFNLLEEEPRRYLENSGAMQKTPIERLLHMNTPAYELYKNHGIDLAAEPLEIDMCAQHNNGGLAGDIWYESISLKHFFIIGEANGVFGIHRPGGSALNSTQVGSMRAAEKITSDADYRRMPSGSLPAGSLEALLSHYDPRADGLSRDEILAMRQKAAARMTACGAFVRRPTKIREAIAEIRAELNAFSELRLSDASLLGELLINRDILLTQLVYLSAITEYVCHGGLSRGSYLITDEETVGTALPPIDTAHRQKMLEVRLTDGAVSFEWRDVRPIPERNNWFETVYNAYRQKRQF